MGIYLNSGNTMFMQARRSEIYVDKSGILSFLNSVVFTEQKYVCVSRPRRFGKTMTASMISCYYDKTCNAKEDFRDLAILRDPGWDTYANRYDVLHLNMQEFLSRRQNVPDVLDFLRRSVLWDLKEAFPLVQYFDDTDMIRSMEDISQQTESSFVIVIDEWDCIFREFPYDLNAQKRYLDFLRDWLKDKSYIALAYMTGILPIKKYGTHSDLNMFTEFSMEHPGKLAPFVGFTDLEVEALCHSYQMQSDDCRYWYDGYHFPECAHVYSPKSIVSAMLERSFRDYWNRTETYEALKIYIDINFNGLKDRLIALMAGESVKIDPGHFQNDMTSLSSADDVLTLLIHLGYLGYRESDQSVFIPNHEIQMEFIRAMDGQKWLHLQKTLSASARLLRDTWNFHEAAVADAVEKAHFETSHLQYNDENALSYTISLAYYASREYYTIVRELPTGKGFADLAFIPRRKYADKPAMIVELKWDKTAETAISQIKEKNYPQALLEYKDNLLLVGISYDKRTKKHTCMIEQKS